MSVYPRRFSQYSSDRRNDAGSNKAAGRRRPSSWWGRIFESPTERQLTGRSVCFRNAYRNNAPFYLSGLARESARIFAPREDIVLNGSGNKPRHFRSLTPVQTLHRKSLIIKLNTVAYVYTWFRYFSPRARSNRGRRPPSPTTSLAYRAE